MSGLGGSADPGIEAVAGIEISIGADQGRLRLIEMADIVLGRILRPARIEQRSHPML